MKNYLSIIALTACFAVIPTTLIAANTIISDDFNGANGAALAGRTPDLVNLPGTSYSVEGTTPTLNTSGIGNIPLGIGLQSVASTSHNSASWLSIGSNGGYVKPSILTLSATIDTNSMDGHTLPDAFNATRGVGLGFFNSAPQSGDADASIRFTGLSVQSDTGQLFLIVNGVRKTFYNNPYPSFATGSMDRLTYSIDTTTGAISSVFAGSNDISSFFTGTTSAGAFTDAATNLVGFYGSSASLGTTGYVGSFVVSSTSPVPEPTSTILLLAGFGIFCAARWRKDSDRRATF
ncbi:MAG: PEP-CTERM sorting domain-containing protein [Verrucomicrobiota bacterium]